MRMHTQLAMMILTMLLACSFAAGQEATTQPSGGEKPDLVPSQMDDAAKPQPSEESDQPAGSQPAPDSGDGSGGGLFSGNWVLPVMIGAIALMWILMGRSKRKREARRREMLAGIKKGEKVLTIGGVVGTVIEVREDEVTVKVDETNNIRMRFARWAIRSTGDEAKTDKKEDERK